MRERIQKIISSRGIASRRAAEKMIADGRITVNGSTAALGDSADPETDAIELDGVPLRGRDAPIYIALNKPKGYITTVKDDRGRPTVMELTEDCGVRVYPVGRLDADSQGLLILTNDGELANRLCHPSGEKDKRYIVTVKGNALSALETLNGPMNIDGYTTRPAEVRILSATRKYTTLEFVLREGRNRQIRKMCSQCRLHVVSLVRTQYAGISLGDLPEGKWRRLTEAEIAKMQ